MKYLFLILFFLTSFVYSQQQVVAGLVQDEKKIALSGVNIIDKNTGKWVISDERGAFSLAFSGEYELEFILLGMEKQTLKGKVTSVVVTLKEETLSLKEVVVTATQVKEKASSAITLDKYAISQFQTFSLSDILQQLPGQAIKNTSFDNPKSITLRTALSASRNNSFGVGFIIDDMMLSNDENMQTYGYTQNSGAISSFQSNVNSSIDLRSIPSSDIEKVEVVSGIADAKYGNATSGLVIVERKAGISPLQVAASMVAGGNNISFQKGFKLPNRMGNLSLSMDYLNSNSDPRNSLLSFNRITGSGIWSVSVENRIKNTLSLSLRSNLDDRKSDNELEEQFRDGAYKREYGLTFSDRITWQIGKPWIDQIGGTMGFAYAKTDSSRERYINRGGSVVPLANETSFHQGAYTPISYRSQERTIGEPININFALNGNKEFSFNNIRHFVSAGAGLNYSDNIGEGKILDTNSASAQTTLNASVRGDSQQGVRPLNFNRYVIASKLFHIYVQDNITYTLSERQSLLANIGLRYENQNGFSSLSPRINAAFVLSPTVKIRGGLGLATKAPSLQNRFPGNVYFDILVRDLRTNDYAINYVQTYVVERPEVSLKPAQSWKYELGTDLSFSFVRLNLTGFINQNSNNFENEVTYGIYPIPELSFTNNPNPALPPSYTITGYRNVILSYQTTRNSGKSMDKGIELMAHFDKIEAINTQFSLSGTYIFSNAYSDLPYIIANSNTADLTHRYIYYNKRISEQDKLSLRLTATYHLPFLGLLASLTVEQFSFSNVFASVKDIYPIGYLNNNLEYTTIPESERTSDAYQALRQATGYSTQDRHTPIYHNFHLRLTKELQNGLSLSFYINNIANYRPLISVNGNETRMNEEISFGAKATFKFGKL